MTRDWIKDVLERKGFRVDDGDSRMAAEKDGFRLTLMFDGEGDLVSVIEEAVDTSAFIRLSRDEGRGITLSVGIEGDGISFTRSDRISKTMILI